VKDFRQLKVWEKSHRLALEIYKATRAFPASEIYGLTSQVRRAAHSVPANIAEGCGRGSDNELARSLKIAMGSANELEYHLLFAKDLEVLDFKVHCELEPKVVEVKKMLSKLIQKLKADS